MVALMVVGIAIPALLSQVSAQVDGTLMLREKMVAHWVAENQLTRLQLQQRVEKKLLRGRDTGVAKMAGRDWHWRIKSSDTSFPGLMRLDIEVGKNEDEILTALVGFLDEP